MCPQRRLLGTCNPLHRLIFKCLILAICYGSEAHSARCSKELTEHKFLPFTCRRPGMSLVSSWSAAVEMIQQVTSVISASRPLSTRCLFDYTSIHSTNP